MLEKIFMLSQIIIGIIICYYIISRSGEKKGSGEIKISTSKESEKLRRMKNISLNIPTAEKTRPSSFDEIKGQENAIKALKTALFGENPQHILIYGPAGVGKTAASRIALEEAKKSKGTPFAKNAKFIEADATIMRFDERSIADPLIGSVHDPIYQGAGLYGSAGIPQIKEGAVSKAHGGVLFIDEIGELHPIQLNKLLKVLEDRRVYFESAYYSENDKNIPDYLHDIFKNGLPADFRLIGATTCSPDKIPMAVRSRCTEIFFDSLTPEILEEISANAVAKLNILADKGVAEKIAEYARNGRDCVRITETCASLARLENRYRITLSDVRWVTEAGRYTKRYDPEPNRRARVGVINGMAVMGDGSGNVLRIEATAKRVSGGDGKIYCTGIIEEERIEQGGREVIKKGSSRESVMTALSAVSSLTLINVPDYDIHINFPSSPAVDGPSAGAAIFCAVCSAVKNIPIDPDCAVTGEITAKGDIVAVGGVRTKVAAARKKGISRIFIPSDNLADEFISEDITAVSSAAALLRQVLAVKERKENIISEAI